jgi:hypothetical protein
MHWRTFDKLASEHDVFAAESLAWMIHRFGGKF